MNNNLLDFVAITNTNPALIINPDSITTSHTATYTTFRMATINFKMLDGNYLDCRTASANDIRYITLMINGEDYRLDNPDNNPLFSFDIYVLFKGQYVGNHYFAHCNDTTEEYTSSDYTPYTMKQVIATSDSVLQMMTDMGLSVETGIDPSTGAAIQNSISIYNWKCRFKIAKSVYGSFRYYDRTYGNDCSPQFDISTLGSELLNNSDFATAKAWFLTIFESISIL